MWSVRKFLINFDYAVVMEYACHIFSKHPVFQMKNLVFQSKYLVFRSKTLDFNRNTRYFESGVSKYQVFHTLNSKYQVFRAKYLLFQFFSGFYVCPVASASVVPRTRRLLSKYLTSAQLNQQQKHSTPFFDSLPIQQVRVVRRFTNRFKLELSLADKHYINNSGFHIHTYQQNSNDGS